MTGSRHANLWEETSEVSAPNAPTLENDVRADVLVVGAGYLGLSAALHLAEAGVRDVIVLDAHHPGWGASGRNGGQVIPGLKHDPDELEALFGRERGERLWHFAGETADLIFDLVRRHGLRCRARRTAWVQALHSERAVDRAKQRTDQWRRRGAPVAFLGPADTAAMAGTDRYLGAFLDCRAGSLHPLDYARELARVAVGRGVRLHGGTPVRALRREGSRWRADTDGGVSATAGTVLVCTNAYARPDLVNPDLPASIVAANSLQIATAPLPEEHRRRILPGGEVLSDTRKVIRYWRLDDAGRLVMGGRGPYREPKGERDWRHLVRDVRELFPFLGQEIRVTHRWGGRVAIHPDYLPRLHAPQPNLLVALGCQGRGIGWQTAMGAELARLTVDPAYKTALPVSRVEPIRLHRFKALGVSATVAAYRAMDRLGIG
jgi:glycine/D-amino acid oxidase-like deaminating enzyme